MKIEPHTNSDGRNIDDDRTASELCHWGKRRVAIDTVDTTAIIRINPAIKELSHAGCPAHAIFEDIGKALEKLERKPERVVLNLSGIEFLRNEVLGYILQIHHGSKVQEPPGSGSYRAPAIALAELQEQPRAKLETTKLNSIIPCFKDTETAVESRNWGRAA